MMIWELEMHARDLEAADALLADEISDLFDELRETDGAVDYQAMDAVERSRGSLDAELDAYFKEIQDREVA